MVCGKLRMEGRPPQLVETESGMLTAFPGFNVHIYFKDPVNLALFSNIVTFVEYRVAFFVYSFFIFSFNEVIQFLSLSSLLLF